MSRALSLVASVVRLVCGAFAFVLVTQIVFVLFAANPTKWITRSVADWSNSLTLGLRGLFTPGDPTFAVVVDYGVPAIVWLVISAIVVGVLRAVARRRAV